MPSELKACNYTEQDGCHNCEYVFIRYEHEEGPWYYCHIDKSKRPLCGSVAMKESWLRYTPRKYNDVDWKTYTEEEKQDYSNLSQRSFGRYMDKWDAWADPREVKAWGKCDKHEPRKEPK